MNNKSETIIHKEIVAKVANNCDKKKMQKNSGKNFSENLVKELSRCFLTHFNTPPRREVVVGEYPPPHMFHVEQVKNH